MTDSVFGRMLLASVCGILLCMACLVGTTWAWFTVSVENTGNVIQIRDAAVTLHEGKTALVSGSTLTAGEHTVTVTRTDSGEKPLYVIFRLGETTPGYVTLEAGASVQITLTVVGEGNTTLSWTESWNAPENLPLLYPKEEGEEEKDGEQNVGEEKVEEETVSSSPSADPSVTSTPEPTPTPEVSADGN